MAKQIIVLDVTKGPGGDTQVGYVFWYSVPSGREVPRTGAKSVYRAATTAENDAIVAGQVFEEVFTSQWPSTVTKAKVQADLVSRYTSWASEMAGKPNINQFYGVSYDSSAGWSA
jgi:hypothetical protein